MLCNNVWIFILKLTRARFHFRVKHFLFCCVVIWGWNSMMVEDLKQEWMVEIDSPIRKSGVNPKCAESLLIRYSKHINWTSHPTSHGTIEYTVILEKSAMRYQSAKELLTIFRTKSILYVLINCGIYREATLCFTFIHQMMSVWWLNMPDYEGFESYQNLIPLDIHSLGGKVSVLWVSKSEHLRSGISHFIIWCLLILFLILIYLRGSTIDRYNSVTIMCLLWKSHCV